VHEDVNPNFFLEFDTGLNLVAVELVVRFLGDLTLFELGPVSFNFLCLGKRTDGRRW
jgi:hypothetical protein